MKIAKLMLGVALGTVSLAASAVNTATSSFTVTAVVANSCSVSAAAMTFVGGYSPASGLPAAGTSNISVTCTLGTAYDIGLSGGASGSVNARTLASGGNNLSYELCQNVGCTTNWGNTVGTDTVHLIGTGLPVASAVTGKIGASQNVPAGTYTDTINVTVTY